MKINKRIIGVSLTTILLVLLAVKTDNNFFYKAGVSLMVLGSMLNLTVVLSNKGRMPVEIPDEFFDDKKDNVSKNHFGFPESKKDSIKFYKLVDRFPLKFKKKVFKYSIGDVVLFSGFIILQLSMLIPIIFK